MSEAQERGALALTKHDFDTQALAMLPEGFAWSRDPAAVQTRLIRGLVGVHHYAYTRIQALLDEADPRTTIETLSMWETDCGLPEPCVGELAPTIALRRRDVIAKRQAGATTTPQDFVDYAATLGWDVSVIEFRPFRTWSGCNAFLNTAPDWSHTWLVKVHDEAIRVEWMTCRSFCNEFIATWGYSSLECAIMAIAPSQTIVIFSYGTGGLPPMTHSIWDAGASVWDDGASEPWDAP
jgi:uncharacterized protein YmfQ (DUF2313 family)